MDYYQNMIQATNEKNSFIDVYKRQVEGGG